VFCTFVVNYNKKCNIFGCNDWLVINLRENNEYRCWEWNSPLQY
jgi:hypothetical protein